MSVPYGVSLHKILFSIVICALLALWGLSTVFALAEKERTLEKVADQLSFTINSLADVYDLSQRFQGADQALADRSAAIWRALLLYPEASFWFEADGETTAGAAPEQAASERLHIVEERGTFSVHASLPREAVLSGWTTSVIRSVVLLAAVSAVFLVLTHLLVRALRQRSRMEQDIATASERERQSALYQQQLERDVAERTTELNQANLQLAGELKGREQAEAELRQHDALLSAVATSAAELLGAHDYEDALPSVLELVGKTISVSHVLIHSLSFNENGHCITTSQAEWCAPHASALQKSPVFQRINVTERLPGSIPPLLAGHSATFRLADLLHKQNEGHLSKGVNSVLRLPIHVEDKLWGVIDFMDSAPEGREWNWAEEDALKTLAGLIGISRMRAEYVRELASANTIVQNSPTILYRLKGDPSLTLLYVSPNIAKFGYTPEELIAKGSWFESLVDPDSRFKVISAMMRTLESGVESATQEFQLRHADGSYRWVENRYTPIRDGDGRLVEIEGIIIDITERKTAEEKIATLAKTDALTGLANRATFSERLRQSFIAAKRGDAPFAILYIDLDHFKPINDTLGHPVGDKLLKEVSVRLKNCVRSTDVVARLGGDEFAVIQTNMAEVASAGSLAETIGKILEKPYKIDGNELHVTSSIGICPYSTDSESADQMLSQADLALYRSKEEGRNRFRFHSDDLDNEVVERVTLANDLRKALDANELALTYLPQVEISDGTVVGMEALLRWHHPEKGVLSAESFIADAERTGTIMALGRWVLNEACRQMKVWKDEGIAPPSVTINLAAAQLKNSRELLTDVKECVEKWKLEPADLEFDVTEAMLAQARWTHNNVLEELRAYGVKLAIDDFGTAYSSLDYLRSYQVNHLKIARPFIEDALKDPERASTVRAIVNLGREMGVVVIAEGIETEEQRELLLSMNRDTQGQGYFYSKPINAEEASSVLRGGQIVPSAAAPAQQTQSETEDAE